ncbi:hypothetical protein [Streptomyces montanisoli]|uniref:Uncharacterized protein n=1 Tax=Streptomyces montanisoli TaxID=2798581 RepID=A0A940MGC5_9ACTN|nr:hypothetical protein [Streptomyces montanisoli]MBP0460363.1 hypothetical protein [Streptomyces montanisoli]
MTQSEARRALSELTQSMGTDGTLIVPKGEGAAERPADAWDEWEDSAPGKALQWPKCECGSPKCPDYDALRTKVAERNKRSSRGGT